MGTSTCLLPGLFAHPTGALWLPESRTAIVADVHLGYSWAQRRRGELGPLADFHTRDKLFKLVEQLVPATLVFLGDVVHAPRPCAPEREWIEAVLLDLGRRASLVAVRGNHDRAFGREFGHLPIAFQEQWSNDSITAVHGDRLSAAIVPEQHTLIAGHLHPSLAIRDAAGASHKLRVFLASRTCVVLPAFSPFAGGYDVTHGLPKELLACFRGNPVEAYAATETRVARLGPLCRAVEVLCEEDAGGPAQFRQRGRAARRS